MSLFWFKKMAAQAATPFDAAVVLLGLGVVLLFIPRRKSGPWLVLSGAVVLFFFSMPAVADFLARPLEEDWSTLNPRHMPAGLGAVVVLGGGSLDGVDLTPATRLGEGSLKRTLEGVRLWRARPKAKLVFASGSWIEGQTPVAELMAQVAMNLGVDAAQVVVETRSRDTFENAAEVKRLLDLYGLDLFVLVTSARHMKRALAVFGRRGLKPIPAPTDFRLAPPGQEFGWWPSLGALVSCHHSLYEYLGYAWYWIRGRI